MQASLCDLQLRHVRIPGTDRCQNCQSMGLLISQQKEIFSLIYVYIRFSPYRGS